MKLTTGNISLSEHAWERIQLRFPNQSKNKKMATDYVRSLLKSSKYIGIIPSGDGNESHMYVYNHDIAIHIALDGSIVTTIYKLTVDTRPSLTFRNKVEDIYKKEFRKVQRLEIAKRRRVELIKAKNEAEIANLRYRKLKTRSQNVRNECDTKIKGLELEIEQMNSEIRNIQDTKRGIAYAIASNSF